MVLESDIDNTKNPEKAEAPERASGKNSNLNCEHFLRERLQKREGEGTLRRLRGPLGEGSHELIDFCSNDYLGFARSPELAAQIEKSYQEYLQKEGRYINGSGASRLVSGNFPLFEEVEQEIAAYHMGPLHDQQIDQALLFNSGYDANLGLLSSVANRNDTILYDQYAHASIRDAIVLSRAKGFAFEHNNIDSLKEKAGRIKGAGRVFIVVESIYSMDGDSPDLAAMAQFASQEGYHLIVDEAHATGVIGERGEGMVAALGLQESVFARVHTYGKAMGLHGAAVIGSPLLKKYLVNYGRSFIYSTAMTPLSVLAIRCAYRHLANSGGLIQQLRGNIETYRQEVEGNPIENQKVLKGPIQNYITPHNKEAKKKEDQLAAAGLDVRAILPPTVPASAPRLRICLHAYNTKEEIRKIVEICAKK